MKTYQLCIAIVASISILSSCNDQLPIVTAPKAQITSYHESTLKSENRNANFNKSINIYIDYSGGMFLPINQCYDLIDEIITITNKKSTVFYNVGLGEPYKIKGNILKPAHPKNPRQNSNYTDAESYLDDAIDSITNDYNSQSIFITDFELYKKGKLDPSPWATLSFEDWLSKGHQIDIFAKEFNNRYNKSQYLYIILFIPKNYPSDESLIGRLQQDGFANSKEIEWFSFSNNLGTAVKNGDAYDKKATYTTQEYEDEKFGYYAFDFETVKAKSLFNSIVFKNTSQNYKDVKIEYEVTDISISFSQNKKGKTPSKETFDISIDKNQEEYTFDIKLSNNITGLNNSKELHRIDFYLTDARADFDTERMDNILQWTNESTGVAFSSLNKSLQEAIKRVKPQKELLYTYYIELSL
jgi:hypothetical protein